VGQPRRREGTDALRRAAALAVLAIACSHPHAPHALRASLPPSFAMQVVVPWQGNPKLARLRLDDTARPYLVTDDTFVPLAHLPSGADARPFRIGGVTAIGDVAWADGGVMLLVADQQLDTVDEHGLRPLADLPVANMRVVAAGTEQCWLFAPSAADGRLYIYNRAGTVEEILRAPTAIHAVSGPVERAYAAIDTSIVRVSASGGVELVFDGGQPIVALAAARAGVFFSTATGTFFLSERNALTRVMRAGATAIEIRGDDLFLVLDGVGIVRGTPVSAFAAP
jgi:hypothetical protein